MSAAEALQATLAHEHAAVFVLSTLAARTSRSAAPGLYSELTAAHQEHRARRDQLTLMVTDLGQTPAAAEAAYTVTRTVTNAGLRSAAVELENSSSVAYATLVGRTSGEDRTWAVAALASSSAREVRLGAASTPWPGAPELA